LGYAAANRFAVAVPAIEVAALDNTVAWPAVTETARPWSRWWWLGSAVDKQNITLQLEAYHSAGLGGVEITCIYGVRGAEVRELPFLSPAWVDAVRHAVREAQRLGIGVDLPTGSGWRTGGPSVTDEDANVEVVIEHEPFEAGSRFNWTFDQAPPQALVAFGPAGQFVDLGERLHQQAATGDLTHVEWPVPDGEWTRYTVTERWSRDNVKRPAPGGEGKNINPLSRQSLMNFLNWFGGKLDGLPAEGIRAQFHDSYEYEGNWCDDFLAQFEKRRGYKLEHHLPALSGKGDPENIARVKHDYRETVSDLVLEEFIGPWTAWSHEHGMLSRNQSHGSPANWLDLYAACDIPEIESFGRLEGGDTRRHVFMFASSAAHVAGKPLVSAETATWLNEHFTTTLAEVKEICDRLFLAGVNHVFYHGTCYSPADAEWPGWLFYASTQLNPQNSIWRDFPALNEYVARCQSILQATQPDNDILLYWPIHDFWQQPRGLRADIRVHNSGEWFGGPLADAFEQLDQHGYTFDYVSDRQLVQCRVVDGKLQTAAGTSYAIVLVPGTRFLPIETGRALSKLAEDGATIVSHGRGPEGTPGWKAPQEQAEFEALAARFMPRMKPVDGYSSATLGRGQIVLAQDLPNTLRALGVRCEQWSAPRQLQFHRRAWSGGHVYFVKNQSPEPFDDWISLAVDWHAAVVMDPLDGRVGLAQKRGQDAFSRAEDGRSPPDAEKKVLTPFFLRLQLAPGQTVFVKTYREPVEAAAWAYREAAAAATPLDAEWSVEFVTGGPELPAPFTTHRLASWTELAGSEAEQFAGTARYSTTFKPDAAAERYLVDLGRVADSARIELNGQPVATLIGPPYQVEIRPLPSQPNRLIVEVTNVAANRIRDLDRRGVRWRIFKDINFVNINYRPFDASDWPIRAAGLLGPVTLTPLAD
jgi:hypothetical protein